MPLIAVFVALLSGCGDDDDPPPTDPCEGDTFIGSLEEDAEIEPGEIGFDGTFTPIADGANLHLFTPPQGGKIVLVGAHVHNMDGCGAVLTGRLRDPTDPDQAVAVHEERTVRFVEMDDRPGWGRVPTGRSEFGILAAGANIPTCFNYEDRDMDGCAWLLDLTVEDRTGRLARATLPVTMTCPEDDPGAESSNEKLSCECECGARFDLRDCSDLPSWEGVDPVCEVATE